MYYLHINFVQEEGKPNFEIPFFTYRKNRAAFAGFCSYGLQL